MSPKLCTVPSFKTQFKVSIVGCGNVGATAAYAMLIDGTPTEIVMIDRSPEKVRGLLLDFEHSMAFLKYTKITATDDYNACADSQLIFVTAGARQKEGETRLDLVDKNKKIFGEIIPKLVKAAPNAILVIVSNPVDILTHEAIKLSGFPEGRVFGTGTMLDTARFQFHLSEKLCLSPKSLDAYVLGEHGDTSFPVWSTANVAGKLLTDFEGFTRLEADRCYEDTKKAAYRIINDLGFTCYSIAIVMREIMVHIFQHSRIVLPLSVPLDDYYGHSGVCLSVPCVLDSTGVSDVIKIPLNGIEQEKLKLSVYTLKEFC